MDSLNALGNSLPPANLANAEKDLLNTFKAAAQSITTLYRASRQTSKRAYNAGYVQACEDLLRMIRHGLSDAGRTGGGDEGGAPAMDVGRVMDWVDARLEAIRAREEEEDEDEERERARSSATAGSSTTTRQLQSEHRLPMPPPATTPAPADGVQHPSGPAVVPTPVPTSPPTSPISSPTSTQSRPIHPLPAHVLRTVRGPTGATTMGTTGPAPPDPSAPSLFHFPSHDPPSLDPGLESVATGAKRRHALMLALNDTTTPASVHGSSALDGLSPAASAGSAASTPGSTAGSLGRRRTRSTMRATVSTPQVGKEEDMDVDEGRERKRVARR
jgi:hypothetical protein